MIVSLLVPLATFVAFETRPRPTEGQSHLVALASGLTGREADTLRAHLELRRVPYLMRDGGQTVMVPADRRAELTVELTHMAARRDSGLPEWTTDFIPDGSPVLRGTGAPASDGGRRAPAQGTADRE